MDIANGIITLQRLICCLTAVQWILVIMSIGYLLSSSAPVTEQGTALMFLVFLIAILKYILYSRIDRDHCKIKDAL